MTPPPDPNVGINFRKGIDGRRSSSAAGRCIVGRALASVDDAAALAAEQESAWRRNYLKHFRLLVEAGLPNAEQWLDIARDGLDELAEQMTVVTREGLDQPLATLLTGSGDSKLVPVRIDGGSRAESELVLPYRGRQLRGEELRRQVECWSAAGVMEPSAVTAIEALLAHPEWLGLDGRTVAVLGAGAEMGPATSLLRWGATVAAIDLPRPGIWERLLATARQSAGTLLVPVPAGAACGSDDVLAQRAGADLLTDLPAVSQRLVDLPGRLVLGNYIYADGATHLRVSTAVDILTERLLQERDDVALAFLATPTDVFAVPQEAVQASSERYEHRSLRAKVIGRPLRTSSRGRLLHRAYPPDADPGICDSLVPVQGPNYALAKRVQRWRAAVERAAGGEVSFRVAPATRTRSVVKNRALVSAYAGAHRFGVEIFEPETANTLMAALLVHDLQTETPSHEHPWQDEAFMAVHGGLWRTAYTPRSALGLAAVLGYAAARR